MISIDLRWLLSSGMGTYLQNTIPRVIAAFPQLRFSLLGDVRVMQKYPWAAQKNVHLVEVQSRMYSISEQFVVLRRIPKETKLYWATHYNVPLLYQGKMLVVVYDLFHLAMPRLVGGLHKRFYAKAMFNAVRRKAAGIITISNFTKKELIRFTGEGPQEIYSIHLGVDDSLFDIKKTNNPHGKPFLLYVGNVKPHKNLSTLVRAFGSLMNKIPHDLVIIGKKEGFITGDGTIASEAAKLGNRVYFTGYIEDKILRQYFIHASAFVFPSFYEGFGLPPLEAMAVGCPVIVSNTAAMPEVCGDAALYCNPYQYEDIAEKILALLSDERILKTLRRKGLEHAKQFSWDKCAKETCMVINNLLECGSLTSR